MKKAFDKKVHPREFQEGDLVIKKLLPMQKALHGKWSPNYQGPYVVKKAFSRGALILEDMDGKDLPNPINLDAIKRGAHFLRGEHTPREKEAKFGRSSINLSHRIPEHSPTDLTCFDVGLSLKRYSLGPPSIRPYGINPTLPVRMKQSRTRLGRGRTTAPSNSKSVFRKPYSHVRDTDEFLSPLKALAPSMIRQNRAGG
ncbi:hypothetical protein VNO77_27193 [Canavalia gladiata]|uniref:Uncharacterized protein n=1 Tax=Canavalia gladiata TaxID=3824 RepID=A0AAN9QAA0_CANGL